MLGLPHKHSSIYSLMQFIVTCHCRFNSVENQIKSKSNLIFCAQNGGKIEKSNALPINFFGVLSFFQSVTQTEMNVDGDQVCVIVSECSVRQEMWYQIKLQKQSYNCCVAFVQRLSTRSICSWSVRQRWWEEASARARENEWARGRCGWAKRWKCCVSYEY